MNEKQLKEIANKNGYSLTPINDAKLTWQLIDQPCGVIVFTGLIYDVEYFINNSTDFYFSL